MQKCWDPNPDKRPTAKELVDKLNVLLGYTITPEMTDHHVPISEGDRSTSEADSQQAAKRKRDLMQAMETDDTVSI